MTMTNAEYAQFVKERSPATPLVKNSIKAFITGGLICAIGQGILYFFISRGLSMADAQTAMSVTLIFIGALLTGLQKYDDIAKFGGAGTLVPITGFANAVASPALEFKAEGYVTGLAAKMFIIAGPVIVFGVTASAVYGLILAIVF